jgi:hypothetical protein
MNILRVRAFYCAFFVLFCSAFVTASVSAQITSLPFDNRMLRIPAPLLVIPFRVEEGEIYIKATLSGKELDCVFDTGSDFTQWAAWLDLKGKTKDTGHFARNSTISPRGGIPKVEIELDTIEIGVLSLRAVSSYKVFTDRIPDGDKMSLHNTPRLGGSIFAPFTIAIDYSTQTISLYDANIPLHSLQRRKDAVELRLTMTREENGLVRRPTIRVRVAEKPARMIIDTGSRNSFVTPQYKGQIEGMSVNKNMPVYPSVPLLLRSARREYWFPLTVLVSPEDNPEFEGVLGYDALKHFRILINYQKQQVVLEPHSEQ